MRMIQETPGVQGGYPCVEDTRIPVRSVVEAWRCAGDDLDVLYAYTDGIGLSRDEVQHALLWYVAHPARVDEDIARQRAAWDAWDRESHP